MEEDKTDVTIIPTDNLDRRSCPKSRNPDSRRLDPWSGSKSRNLDSRRLDPWSGPDTILLNGQIVLVHRHPGWLHVEVDEETDDDDDDNACVTYDDFTNC